MSLKINLLSGIAALFTMTFVVSCSRKMNVQNNNSQGVVASGATPQLISDKFRFTEGPASDKKGNVYFTDQPNDKIYKYDTDGNLTVFMENTKRSNGMYFDNDGNLISCADAKNELVRISKDKNITVLLSDYQGKLLNGPNDVWVHPNGDMYITDPLYKRNYWPETTNRVKEENVYRLPKGSNSAELVATNCKKPNGIIGTPDGRTLYVADIGDDKTYKYTINADGSLSEPQLFVNQGSDGMTIDNRGNIYLTGKGVTVYDKNGNKLEQIPIPEGWTSNVSFCGKNKDKLFITASKSVYIIDMNVKGVR